jgi:hypothetical protein
MASMKKGQRYVDWGFEQIKSRSARTILGAATLLTLVSCGGEVSSSANRSDLERVSTPEIEAMIEERVEIARKTTEQVVAQYAIGQAPFERLVAARKAWLEASMQQNLDEAAKIELLELSVQDHQKLEAIAEARYEDGTATSSDMLEAKSATLALQIRLAREKERQRRGSTPALQKSK